MASLQNNNYNSNSDRQYRCKFFIDENDFTAITKDSFFVKKNHPCLEKNMFIYDIPKNGEVLLLSPYQNNMAEMYQIETVYRHLYGTSGRMMDIEIEYRILMKKIYVLTRIVMVEKYKAPVSIPVRNNGRIYNGVDIRNYYYETDEDEYDVFEADDNLCNMPF